MEPNIMTGTLPMVSDNFPLKGRDTIAVTANREMIKPLNSAPPNALRYPGNSGTIILKLAKNKSELRHTSQKCLL